MTGASVEEDSSVAQEDVASTQSRTNVKARVYGFFFLI
jgi:hypothetical protein